MVVGRALVPVPPRWSIGSQDPHLFRPMWSRRWVEAVEGVVEEVVCPPKGRVFMGDVEASEVMVVGRLMGPNGGPQRPLLETWSRPSFRPPNSLSRFSCPPRPSLGAPQLRRRERGNQVSGGRPSLEGRALEIGGCCPRSRVGGPCAAGWEEWCPSPWVPSSEHDVCPGRAWGPIVP